MESGNPNPLPTNRVPVFAICCWAFGLMAFSQLLVAGVALATRFDESKVVKTVEKEKIVVVRVPAPAPPEHTAPVVSRPPLPPPAASLPLPPPTPVSTPSVADPRSERLLKEARKARVAGDMGVAVMKLEEALTQSPEDPSVHYELGLVHEQMGVFDIAGDHFQKVLEIGPAAAGSLYELAAGKLRDGFQEPDAHGKLSLARVRIFKDSENEEGERTILTIPVQKAPGEEIDADKVSVEVLFFNKTGKGDVVQLEDRSWSVEKWMNPPFDWADGEEILRATYTIPVQDNQTEHLFGQRSYYGQVVILRYDGQVVDVQAWPRDLAAKIPSQQAAAPANPLAPEFQDSLPPDFDPNNPQVLPPRSAH